ncbi:hypothetical protein [Microbispora sp. GKU 823]|uniref:hypothetical protein n=1 Tax=Microbispora sp. GKU 823 TaxID=1652100 RepID=UPI0009A3E1AC|nr:hypothetical protein [Microbispora sp. GKU 823]OPG13662.1 hypothetical protein B1L11_06655 [Microbispora sp. GKU 823]
MLGDCLLHLTHHDMQPECWQAAIEHYMGFLDEVLQRPVQPDLDTMRTEGRDRYKADYERALLNALRADEPHPKDTDNG